MIVASMSITIQRCSRFPATVSQGKPPGRSASSVHTCRRTAHGPVQASSRRWRPSPPGCGGWWSPTRPGRRAPGGGPAAAGLGQVPRAEHDRDSQLDHHRRPLPPAPPTPPGITSASAAVNPTPSASFRSNTAPGMPDQPPPVGPYGQPLIPPCSLRHQKGAPLLRFRFVLDTAILAGQGTFQRYQIHLGDQFDERRR